MKALPKKLLRLTVFAIAVTSLFFVRPAQAYTVTLEQVGSNVVATGSGAINLSGLSFVVTNNEQAEMTPFFGFIQTGPTGFVSADIYGTTGQITGPTSFGTGGLHFPNSGSGDFVGIIGGAQTPTLLVPHGYLTNASLSDTMTFNNATLASLGVTPGTYVWTWGAGANQRFTLIIGAAGVPDSGSTISLLGCALLDLAALRRKLSC